MSKGEQGQAWVSKKSYGKHDHSLGLNRTRVSKDKHGRLMLSYGKNGHIPELRRALASDVVSKGKHGLMPAQRKA